MNKHQDRPSVETSGLSHGLVPPHLVLRDFLDEETVGALLSYVASRQLDFRPTGLGSGDKLDPSFRVSTALRDLGKFRSVIKTKILALLPTLITQLRVSSISEPKFETELVAHGDGAFYKRHIDTDPAHYYDVSHIRIVSCVYYFYAKPRAFTGGTLRLHAIGGKHGQNFIDIEPARNGLVVFLSWAPHEVLPVSCPSKEFVDSRFAINCWVYGKKPEGPQAKR